MQKIHVQKRGAFRVTQGWSKLVYFVLMLVSLVLIFQVIQFIMPYLHDPRFIFPVAMLTFLVWIALFSLITHWLTKTKRSYLKYFPKTKRLLYYTHWFDFKLFPMNGCSLTKEGSGYALDYTYLLKREEYVSITLQIDEKDAVFIEKILADWQEGKEIEI